VSVAEVQVVDVQDLNTMSEDAAFEELRKCCGSRKWAERMLAARPFASREAILSAADDIWQKLPPEDWIEAFRHHPKIGDLNSLRMKYAGNKEWSQGEQSGIEGASETVLQGLVEGNAAYENRFGHIFIVCATGKSAVEMLSLLKERLKNTPADEIKVAMGEQAKITRLRLEKLLA